MRGQQIGKARLLHIGNQRTAGRFHRIQILVIAAGGNDHPLFKRFHRFAHFGFKCVAHLPIALPVCGFGEIAGKALLRIHDKLRHAKGIGHGLRGNVCAAGKGFFV